MEPNKIIESVTRIVAEELGDGYSVTLIGSRETGRARCGSDYDFLIEGPAAIPLRSLARIRDAVDELPTLAKIDVVDAARASEEFLAVAKQ